MSTPVTERPDTTDTTTISELLGDQKQFFAQGRTKQVNYRIQQLKKLRDVIRSNENRIHQALKADLGKPAFESYITEVGFVLEEINHFLKNLRAWARPEPVSTPITQVISTAKVYREPYGQVLIISPWNYPFQLAITPLVAALGGGNTVVMKPSELAPNTSAIIRELMESAFSAEEVAVVEGGVETNQRLLEQKFDYIFFTGSARVGRIVMEAAAKNLTPVTLELGGKSPCIVDERINLTNTARRIIWGKLLNLGQTCIAPDYVLVQKSVKDQLLAAMRDTIHEFFGSDPQTSPDLGRIINDKHFERLQGYLQEGTIYCGGTTDPEERYIAPTIITDPPMDGQLMQEEIFGPILPVVTYDKLDDALTIINSRPKPLALYIFTNNSGFEHYVLNNTDSGGGCINDTVVHLTSPDLPFGGVGESGMGAYHGEAGFRTFTHPRSFLKKSNLIDPNIRYAPFRNKLNLLKKLMG
jgi:acyl-CoA reductase-like NAD-dependent aldehyde dehydrogenase